MNITQKYLDQLTYQIIGCAIEVHKQIGPGLIESVYEKCFIRELMLKGLVCKSQQFVEINYKGIQVATDLRCDIIVEDLIIVELKAVEGLLPIHEAILLTYMRMAQKPKGILINFNSVNIFKGGQKTLVNKYHAVLPKE